MTEAEELPFYDQGADRSGFRQIFQNCHSTVVFLLVVMEEITVETKKKVDSSRLKKVQHRILPALQLCMSLRARSSVG